MDTDFISLLHGLCDFRIVLVENTDRLYPECPGQRLDRFSFFNDVVDLYAAALSHLLKSFIITLNARQQDIDRTDIQLIGKIS